jgi:hypothetical protein
MRLYVLFQLFDIGVYVCLCNKSPDPNHSGPLTLSFLSKYPWEHFVISCSTLNCKNKSCVCTYDLTFDLSDVKQIDQII